MTAPEAITLLRTRFGDAIGAAVEFRGEHSVSVEPARLLDACRALREAGFNMLTDLSGVDHFGEAPRFEVAYLLYAMEARCRLRLKVRLPEEAAEVDSVTGVWGTADWHEREAFDMFGIRFRGHPRLRRILMWEGYPHHPLRKDFPLAGLPAELPETAVAAGSVDRAPMADGPFVPGPAGRGTAGREPRQFDSGAEQIIKIARPNRQESV